MKVQAAQLYLPKPTYLQFKLKAKMEGKSFATWAKDILEKEAGGEGPLRRKTMAEMPIFSWPDLDPRLSEKIDEVLYGDS